MNEYNDIKIYQIKDTQVGMFSSETAYGWQTIAEVNQQYYYLGDQLFNIATAIVLWENLNNVILNPEEVEKVMLDNSMKSFAV